MAVFVSGAGTILESILRHGVSVDLCVTDRECSAIEVAKRSGVPIVMKDRSRPFDRLGYSNELHSLLVEYGVTHVALAGFGTVLVGELLTAYRDLMVNTHPSLLPSFPGWNSVEQALSYGVKVTGTTVHMVVPEVDAGPIVAQRAVMVLRDDDVETLHERIKSVERHLYPVVLKAFVKYAKGQPRWWDTRQVDEYLEAEENKCAH